MMRIYVHDENVKKMIAEYPAVANSEFNRAFQMIGGLFYRRLWSQVQGKLKIKRSGGRSGKGPNRVFVPAKLRTLGFSGKLGHSERLQGKTLTLGTSSPVAIGHVRGGIIRPHGQYLMIRVKTRKAALQTGTPKHKVPFVFFARQVTLPQRIPFYETWEASRPAIDATLVKAVERMVKRIQKHQGAGPSAAGGE